MKLETANVIAVPLWGTIRRLRASTSSRIEHIRNLVVRRCSFVFHRDQSLDLLGSTKALYGKPDDRLAIPFNEGTTQPPALITFTANTQTDRCKWPNISGLYKDVCNRPNSRFYCHQNQNTRIRKRKRVESSWQLFTNWF